MKPFSQETIISRFEQYYAYALIYVKSFIAEDESPLLRVNPQSMYIATKSAYDDIFRYKVYHQADPRNGLSNSVKRAAYICKWLNKFRPIEYVRCPENENYEYDDIAALLVNGAFALLLCRTFIGEELQRPFFYTNEYNYEFQYDLLYRNLGDDGLLHIFQMIFSAVKVHRAGVLEFISPPIGDSVLNDRTE